MSLNDAQKTLIVLMAVLVTMCSLFVVYDAMGQQTTTTQTTTQPQPQSTTTTTPQAPSAIDPATLAAVAGPTGAGILVATVKQILDQRKNANRDKTTDKDTGRFIILISKFYQAKYMYPWMTDKEILDLPISYNPLNKTTLGQAITAEADLWDQGNQSYWGLPANHMSVPTATTIEAINRPNQTVPLVPASTNNPAVAPSPANTTGKPATTTTAQNNAAPANKPT